nr:DUF1156 domain-containing protein [Methanosphaerula palustris]
MRSRIQHGHPSTLHLWWVCRPLEPADRAPPEEAGIDQIARIQK